MEELPDIPGITMDGFTVEAQRDEQPKYFWVFHLIPFDAVPAAEDGCLAVLWSMYLRLWSMTTKSAGIFVDNKGLYCAGPTIEAHIQAKPYTAVRLADLGHKVLLDVSVGRLLVGRAGHGRISCSLSG
ncbi:hypothetical protein Moror_8402 [Moniliophthora roreri MCA 2997]|uniref:Uncharacterized protein n=1 Tax=Moniliophthora roreri (strain MCA 2997) TaxID=1381753 RepID=V2XKF5_MONRO|nr:hypothetical protein Moror_8402 [Moniliophthora roreri MCA 2997]